MSPDPFLPSRILTFDLLFAKIFDIFINFDIILIHNIPNYIFRLRQGAKEPEQPRTAAINTNLEDLGEETIDQTFLLAETELSTVPTGIRFLNHFVKKFHDF